MYSEFIKNIKDICRKKGFKIQKIGAVGKKKKWKLYKITINCSTNPKKTICFSAGIHGNEVAGPFAILEFLKKFNKEKFGGIRIIIFPVDNPYGFERDIRRDYYDKDLNRHFCERRLNWEDKILHNALKREKIFFFHSLHEDKDSRIFYLYDFEKRSEKIYRNVINLAKKYFKTNKKRAIGTDAKNAGEFINFKDGSFEDRMSREGVPYSMCTETPSKMPLKKRVECNVKIMNKVLKFTGKNLN